MSPEVFLYTRSDCELCHIMSAELEEYVRNGQLILRHVDIEGDAELTHRYGARIPVLVSGNREICEIKLDNQALRAFLSGK